MQEVGRPITQKIVNLFKGDNAPEITDPIMQRVIKYLSDNQWSFQQGEYFLNARVRCKNAVYPTYISIYEDNFIIRVYSYLDSTIYEDKRVAVAEFCTRVNYDMPIGNFEFDLDDGEVRYKTSIALGENIEFLTDEIIDRLIWTNINSMDLYYPGIMRINFSNDNNIDVKAIIQEIENSQ
ncbi:YbjN domain-containing protein [Methanosarcina sp. UBA5]|uniref:YbjN domain-containing protein n=1 Tax=Methanosarcina sp. UBA5 TaxID=1915593 RepID=UPI0025DEA75B|nr:YbjN domain-containing protein [Methanosarcina sp. UBA5]